MKIKFSLLLYFATLLALAQPKPIQTSVDTLKKKIGSEFKLSLKVKVKENDKVIFPEPKAIGNLEVIASYPIDTVKEDGHIELIKRYGITQFDSGHYVVPRLPIRINKNEFASDSIAIDIANVKVDTLKQKMYDIKDVSLAPSTTGNWWIYLLVLLAISGLGYFLWKKYKNRIVQVEEKIIYKTPIEKASSLLLGLEQQQLWQKGEVKEYYSQLTDIARNYIEEVVAIPAKESTTYELIEALQKAASAKKMKITNETIQSLSAVLQQADLVKFAKSKPEDAVIVEDMNKIQKVIIHIDKAIPEEVAEDDDLLKLNEAIKKKQEEELRLKKLKKQKQLIIAGVLSFVVLVFGISVAVFGFTNVKDTLLCNASKSLLEGNWVKSEYGNPAVILETPEVLKRLGGKDNKAQINSALVKDMQSFAYGSFVEDFYILVSTLHFNEGNKLELEKALESSLSYMEKNGAMNMIVKQESFKTPNGITGVKGYGTFERLDKNNQSSDKMYYEIILFGQYGGLQQIVLMHEAEDIYAKPITDRILKSVELKQIFN